MQRKDLLSEALEREPFVTGFSPGSGLETSYSAYFGIGISNKHGLTEDLPFDALGMLVVAEMVKRSAGLSGINVLIADEHARFNGCSNHSINIVANHRRDFVNQITERLCFQNFDVMLASEIYGSLHAGCIIPGAGRYECLQAADMETFRRNGSAIKIGWKHEGMFMDERHFDRVYSEVFGNAVTFIYAESGRSLDGTPCAPYLCIGKPRLLLKEDEDLNKIDSASRRVNAYFGRLLDAYDKLVHETSFNHQNTPCVLKRRLRETYSELFGKAWC